MVRQVTTSLIVVFLVTLVSLSAPLSYAALMHPDQMGDTVWFRNIVEDSPTGDPLPLYGPPSTVGDGLDFPTTGNFAATSTSGSGPDLTDGKLTLMIEAKPGHLLDKLSIAETLVAFLDAPFGGDAKASVFAFVSVDVVEINGLPVGGPEINKFLDFVPGDEFQFSIDGSGPFGIDGSAMIPLPQGTTKVNLSLNNSLAAATIDQATLAFIDKKNFDLDVDTIPVPEPATAALALFSMTVGLLRRSRELAEISQAK